MHQLSLLSPVPRARKRDPDTSHDAAKRAARFFHSHQDRILEALATPGTIKELAERCGLDHVAVARRMVEIERDGRAVRTEEKRDGCRVWRRT